MRENPPMPDLYGADYLVHHLDRLGWVEYGFSGALPLSYKEIHSYMETTKTPLNPEEVYLIREMSMSYLSQLNNNDPSAKMPYNKKDSTP
jgi:hypothetical protein